MAIIGSNLKWFYSGGAINSDPVLSIGGTKSNVVLLSTLLNNLFDNVSGAEASVGLVEYRLLYFQNTDGDVDGLMSPATLWVVAQPIGQDTVAVGLAVAGKNSVETAVSDDQTAPAGVVFTAPSTRDTGIVLPSLPLIQNDYIGVWFERTVPAGAASQVSDGFQWRIEGDTI